MIMMTMETMITTITMMTMALGCYGADDASDDDDEMVVMMMMTTTPAMTTGRAQPAACGLTPATCYEHTCVKSVLDGRPWGGWALLSDLRYIVTDCWICRLPRL